VFRVIRGLSDPPPVFFSQLSQQNPSSSWVGGDISRREPSAVVG
jgi:hypothetical protein